MKILAVSDLHRNQLAARAVVAASHEADVVVIAGDLSIEGKGIDDTISILKELIVPTVLVAGNHDNLDALRQACRDWKSATVLHGEEISINGFSFYGLGLEIPQIDQHPWSNHMSEENAVKALALCSGGGVVITHTPPFGTLCDLQRDGAHEGSRAIRQAIETLQPALCLCGHIHHSWGAEDCIGACQITNLGPTLNWFEI